MVGIMKESRSKRLIIYTSSIHVGGGWLLLLGLIRALKEQDGEPAGKDVTRKSPGFW